MRAIDLIEKVRDKKELTEEEIKYFINGYTNDEIEDYQVSAFLMAVYFNGLSDEETCYLTDAMLNSGDIIDLKEIEGIKVDKHSTGGVGDKTSLVLGPLVAACGLNLAKLSGRGLGHTGGTLDKLESIPGVTINLNEERFLNQVNEIGMAIAGQTKNLVPADKKLYALRDVTGTVKSYPLIASSIMSKKLAGGADLIAIDCKYGSGAFMKTIEEAEALSRLMIKIGKKYHKKVFSFITDMKSPLGKAIGNKLEVLEAINCLQNKGPKDLETLCVELCSYMLYKSKTINNLNEAREFTYSKLRDGSAYKKFIEFIKAQGAISLDFNNFIQVKEIIPLFPRISGYIEEIDALTLGKVSMLIGAGRATKEDSIDPEVGILLNKQIGEYIKIDEPILYIYKNDKWDNDIPDILLNAIKISKTEVKEKKLIEKVIE